MDWTPRVTECPEFFVAEAPMNVCAIKKLAIAVGATAMLSSPLQAGNLITNGSFENGSYTFDGNGADSLPAGSTVITGWTTFGAELATIQNTNNFGPITTPFGSIFLDLTGYHDSSPYGGVEQSISTTIGQSYQLTLYLGVYDSNPIYEGPISVQVKAGPGSTTFTDNPTGLGSIWTPFSFSFIANSSSTLISIQGTEGKQYIGLDNVSVIASSAVPEPSTLVLGSAAALLVGAGAAWLRRKPESEP
jgi:hypothetical protein